MSTGRLSPAAHLLRCVAIAALAWSAVPGHAASSLGPQHPPPPRPPDAQAPPASDVDPASRNTVARARMLECGHQWNNMKRAGTASGTWKDFSRGCLAQR